MKRLSLATLAALLALGSYAGPPGPVPAARETTILRDVEGRNYLGLSGLSEARENTIFGQLGTDSTLKPQRGLLVLESADQGGQSHSFQTEYSRFEVRKWLDEALETQRESGVAMPTHGIAGKAHSTLSIAGCTVSTEWTKTSTPSVVVEDSLGGRVEFRKLSYGVKWAQDAHGLIFGATYDEWGRATTLYIGLDYLLETDYPDGKQEANRWNWIERRLKDRAGKVLGTWVWSDNPPSPRPGARVWADGIEQEGMGGGSILAEWDADLYPEGVAMLTAWNSVSVLAPLNGQGMVWRSVHLPLQMPEFASKRPLSVGRLDFTEREFRLWINLGRRDIDPEGRPTLEASAVVHLPRLKATPERIDAFRKSGAF